MTKKLDFTPLPRILAGDIAEFAEILAEDEDFPSAHAAWEHLSEAGTAELADDGYTAKLLDVRPAGCQRFLAATGVLPSMNSLTAYVALLAPYKR